MAMVWEERRGILKGKGWVALNVKNSEYDVCDRWYNRKRATIAIKVQKAWQVNGEEEYTRRKAFSVPR